MDRACARRSIRHDIGTITRAVGLAAMALLWASSTASAKMPGFTVDVTPAEPVAGQPVDVRVRTWQDTAHSVPAGFEDDSVLTGLLVVRATDGSSPDIPIRLARTATDLFTGRFVMPTTGQWMIVAFPDRSGWATPVAPAGYPDTIPLTVRGAWDGTVVIAAIVAGLVAAVAFAAVLAIRAKRHSGWPSTMSSMRR